MKSLVGSLVFSNSGYYQDRKGWFKVIEHAGERDTAICRRVMTIEGKVLKNSLKRIKFDVKEFNVITPEKLEERRQAAYKAADDDLQYLLDMMHK